MLLKGKLSISMAIFDSKVLNQQRVCLAESVASGDYGRLCEYASDFPYPAATW